MAHTLSDLDTNAVAYAEILEHLKQAEQAAGTLGDSAAQTLIEMAQRLCLTHAAEPGAPSAAPNGGYGHGAALNVYFFGAFQPFLNGSPIDGWRKKSGAVFKYLVIHRDSLVHRDQLLDLFWPNAHPQSARNCLNVTLHALRRSLEPLNGSVPAGGLILFADNHYCLSPDLRVWTDVDAFAEQVAQGQAADRQGDRAAALAHYEVAGTLYRGDFLEEDRYDEWTISRRERLRGTYLATLTHLGRLYFEAGDYAAAIECARKILDHDNCCEDAHCQIMRSYYALGQRGQAVRQYFAARDTLDRELGVPPMDATTRLYHQIKGDDLDDPRPVVSRI